VKALNQGPRETTETRPRNTTKEESWSLKSDGGSQAKGGRRRGEVQQGNDTRTAATKGRQYYPAKDGRRWINHYVKRGSREEKKGMGKRDGKENKA